MRTVKMTIENFLGINESPDGDSGLKVGEAADMTNFRVTEEGNLKKMHGYELFTSDTAAEAIDGMIWWNGLLIFVTNGKIYTYDSTTETKTELTFDSGVELTVGKVSLFVFDDKLYLINGHEYLSWEGGTEVVKAVLGYVPTVLIASTPASGAGTLYEAVNQLTPKRIQKFNGDSSAVVYKMGETNIDSIDKVIVNGQLRDPARYTTATDASGYTTVTFSTAPTSGLDNVKIEYSKNIVTNTERFTALAHASTYFLGGKEIDSINSVTVAGSATTGYTADLAGGTVTLASEPTTGAAVVVTWSKVLVPKVKDMKLVQFFGGENNTRAFFYGDGSHTIYYSEPTDGATKASIEYWPELNRMDIDVDSVPVTALLPYYDRLFIFKEDSIFYCKYATLTGDDGDMIISFPTTNVTKSVGCPVYEGALSIPSGIVFPADDGIYLASGGTVYEQMTENLISKVVDKSYKLFDLSKLVTLNNKEAGECWFADGNDVIVYNYRNKTWYKLDILAESKCFLYEDGDVYLGDDVGQIFHFDKDRLSFNGAAINAYWESGSLDFGCFNQKKWIDEIWLTLKSEPNSSVTLDLESDVTSGYPERSVAHGRATFATLDFTNLSFNTNDKPAAKRVKIKAKKFVFVKFILKNNAATQRATVMNLTVPVTVGSVSK